MCANNDDGLLPSAKREYISSHESQCAQSEVDIVFVDDNEATIGVASVMVN